MNYFTDNIVLAVALGVLLSISVGLPISYTAIYNPSIAEGVAYLLMIIVLLIKPEGLFRK